MPAFGRTQSRSFGPCFNKCRKLFEALNYSIGNNIPKRWTLLMGPPNPAHSDLLTAPNIVYRAIPNHDRLIGIDTQAT